MLRVLDSFSILLLVAISLVLQTTSHADVPCAGNQDFGECQVEAAPAGAVLFGARDVSLGHITAGAARSTGGGAVCSYRPVDPHWDRASQLVNNDQIPLAAIFYWIDCPTHTNLRYYIPGTNDPVTDGLLTELIQEAFDRLHTTPPTLTLSPATDRPHLTGLPTWLAIDPTVWDQPPAGTVTAGSITIDAWLHPDHITWDLGNGDTVTCTTPGTTYDTTIAYTAQAAACGYTYTTTPAHHTGNRDARTYPLTATVTYTAHYRVTGLPGIDTDHTLGPIDGPPATTDLTIHEYRAIRTTP